METESNSQSRIGGWVKHSSEEAIDWKIALASYSATHLISYSETIQIGPGTTFNRLIEKIIEIQKRKGEPLDLIILTNNLQVLEQGRDALHENVEVFKTMQIVLTGGSLQPSTWSLAGPYAAEGIRTDMVLPQVVFFGAARLSCENGDLSVSYQFMDELDSQDALATRPTIRRVLLCDHTKLGKIGKWRGRFKVADMMKSADECLVVSTWPEVEEEMTSDQKIRVKIEQEHILRQKEEVDKMVRQLATRSELESKEFIFRLVNKKGEVQPKHEIALSAMRKRLAEEGKRLIKNDTASGVIHPRTEVSSCV